MPLSFRVTRAERLTIHAIARRAIADLQALSAEGLGELDIQLMLTVCHGNAQRLNLDGLLAADPFCFAHDILGLVRHLDPDKGQIAGPFRPRFCAPRDRNAASRQRRFRTGRLAAAMLSQGS
jgi:hypothetical protein